MNRDSLWFHLFGYSASGFRAVFHPFIDGFSPFLPFSETARDQPRKGTRRWTRMDADRTEDSPDVDG